MMGSEECDYCGSILGSGDLIRHINYCTVKKIWDDRKSREEDELLKSDQDEWDRRL